MIVHLEEAPMDGDEEAHYHLSESEMRKSGGKGENQERENRRR